MMGKPSNTIAQCLATALVLVCCVVGGAHAQPAPSGYVQMRSGTGFFVSGSGHLVTNEHVVTGCKEVEIQGAVPRSKAKLLAVDTQYDLALLRAEQRPRRVATIRHPDASRIRIDEPVLVMGYPLDSYKTGEYRIATSRIIGLRGPTEEPHWIQFSDAVQQGNSGGPLLDASGNVAGVVVGKTELTTRHGVNGREQVLRRSDVAISLPVLMRFLDKHYVAYRFNGSYSIMQSKRVEELARGYIVNVQCFLR